MTASPLYERVVECCVVKCLHASVCTLWSGGRASGDGVEVELVGTVRETTESMKVALGRKERVMVSVDRVQRSKGDKGWGKSAARTPLK